MKKVIIWSEGISYLLLDKSVDGISVQLFFWATEFVNNGWNVFAFRRSKDVPKSDIKFIRKWTWHSLDILNEWIFTFITVLRIKPDIIICRGADRYVYALSCIAKLFRIKLVFFAASDVNFVPNKEAIYGKRINRKLYQKAVPLFGKIIAQNEYQQKTLLENYKRQALVLPNVWGIVPQHSTDISCDVIWVANFRKLKRAEWVVDIAKKMPDINIIMVGDGGSDVEYLKSIVHSINSVHNIQYLGKRSFAETNTLIKNSKVLICTSEFEGFPNTFIQAWSFGHPVVSTVDPNNVIKTNNLGYVADNVNDMISALHNLIYSESDYKTKSNKIREFFMKSYSSSNKFAELIKYIDV